MKWNRLGACQKIQDRRTDIVLLYKSKSVEIRS